MLKQQFQEEHNHQTIGYQEADGLNEILLPLSPAEI